MRVLGTFTLVAVLGCASRPTAPGDRLTDEERAGVRGLVGATDDREFDRRLAEVLEWKRPATVVVVAHAMIELPWEPALEPRGRGDLRMKKVRLEYLLDKLVVSSELEGLSAAHFRAAGLGEGSVADTAARLRDWVLARRERLVRDDKSSRLEFLVDPLSREQKSRLVTRLDEALKSQPCAHTFRVADAWMRENGFTEEAPLIALKEIYSDACDCALLVKLREPR